MELKFLVNCRDDFEAQIIEGILKGADIPVERKYQSGDIMRIYGGQGKNVDLYVPEASLTTALALLESSIVEEDPEL